MSSFSGGDDEPSVAEWAVMAVSVAVTLSLFAFVAWHAAATPTDATPEAEVTGTETLEDGRVAVRVAVHNPSSEGLKSVSVSADCSNESIRFTHVPIDDRQRGTVVCPAGTEDPSATVVDWVEA
ncbi:hypothetical protein G9464_15515 [Halostella sp. JP-L12]|uniref:hypothetical protein n=1 Tax=Halostella TaxID=1843185 RepID=UPI000EF7E44E|nr:MULTISPECIES: hypothetical protein [Halostella]NHN48991.1 hypothetical protein [Halostella sp. JP-L12]